MIEVTESIKGYQENQRNNCGRMKVTLFPLIAGVAAAIPGWFRQKEMPRGGGVGPDSPRRGAEKIARSGRVGDSPFFPALLHNNDAPVVETKDVSSDENKPSQRQRQDDSGEPKRKEEHDLLSGFE